MEVKSKNKVCNKEGTRILNSLIANAWVLILGLNTCQRSQLSVVVCKINK